MFDYTMPSMGAVNRRTAEAPSAPPPWDPGSETPLPDASTPPAIGGDLPPEEGVPVFPAPPMGGPGVPPTPSGPVYPVSGYCTVRFLNAAADFAPMRALIGGQVVANHLRYGETGFYWRVKDGFRTVTITSASSHRLILYRQSVPFGVNEIITLAIVQGSSGPELVRISDIPCRSRPQDQACIRTVNLVYNSPALDVILNDGRVVFSDVRYREATAYTQAHTGGYGFYAARTPGQISPACSDVQTPEAPPVIPAGCFLPDFDEITPLTAFSAEAGAGSMNTICLMGRWSAGTPDVHARVIRDF